MIDELDKKIISVIQGDLPIEPRPFSSIAKKLGMEEGDLIRRIRSLRERGVIRRFGATLRHQEAGFQSNAMVAWKVPEERIEEVGRILADFREVTHCYQRLPQEDWRYNLYTMIHGDRREDCYEIASRMSKKARVDDYVLLFSEEEFKKTSMAYF
ncbi:MAG: AsnC family transcriptional regulator [Deltaproteobacteria bacterium]|nr:AsnC family transcriptional regulator [Deltaproteobacteria bacterium]